MGATGRAVSSPLDEHNEVLQQSLVLSEILTLFPGFWVQVRIFTCM